MAKKQQKQRAKFEKRLAQAHAAGDARAILEQAVVSLRRGGTERVLALAEEALALARTPAEQAAARALMVEAHVRAGVNQSQEARLVHFDAALAYEPDSPRLRLYRGLCLWQLGRKDEAYGVLEAAADKPEAYFFVALARLARGHGALDQEGLDESEWNTLTLLAGFLSGSATPPRAPLLGGDEAEPLWHAFYVMSQDPDAAPVEDLQALAKRVQSLPVKRFAHYVLGVAAVRVGDLDTAEAAWRAAEGAGPSPAKLEANLAALTRERALALATRGDYAALIESQAVSGDRIQQETLALAHEHQGYRAAQQGDWRLAVHHWREALALAPRRQLAQNLALAEEAREHWTEAAEAWRAMLRRRPRKRDHPDYLSDPQVAAIWRHAGQCYTRADDLDEAIRCLRQALKYAEDDSALRFELAGMLDDNYQPEAAENELERLLALDPTHKEALVLLASAYDDQWGKDATSLWRRALALAPQDREIQDALARAHLYKAQFLPSGRARKLLEQGLAELPEHPDLLLALALGYEGREQATVRELLTRAYRACDNDVRLMGVLLPELARVAADDTLQEVIAAQRQRNDLLPAFWLDNGAALLKRVGPGASHWAEQLFDEGIAVAERAQADGRFAAQNRTGKAGALVAAFAAALRAGDERLAVHYQERITHEVAASGAAEVAWAYRHHASDAEDKKTIRRFLKEAEQKAKRARGDGVQEAIVAAHEKLIHGPRGLDFQEMFERLRGSLNL